MEKKEVTFQREKLYEEIWEYSLSKVAKKYDVPYAKLKEACKDANIPLPSNTYWGNLHMDRPAPKEPLHESSNATVTVVFSVKTTSIVSSVSQAQLRENDKKLPVSLPDGILGFLSEEDRLRVIKTAMQLQVDTGKRKLHPVLIQHKADSSAWAKSHPRDPYAPWKRDAYRRIPDGEPLFMKQCLMERCLGYTASLIPSIMLLKNWAGV